MGDSTIRFAIDDTGKLYAFTGKEAPLGTTPLTDENGNGLTEAGKVYCQNRRLHSHPETIRVLFSQQSSDAVGDAIKASIKNQETRMERDAKAKATSERLRLDWAAQDKAYQEALKERK